MGTYLNPKNTRFSEAVRSEIYVDKTGLISYTNKYICTEQKYICISRPRRFGKSMALNMLVAYYSRGCDSRELFAGHKIEKDPSFEKYLNQYDVIYLNMQQFLIGAKDQEVTNYLEEVVLEELWEKYGEFIKKPNVGLAYYSARKDYKLIRELPTGKGYADVVFLPRPHTGKPAIVVELKYDSSVISAIQQIKDRQYTQALEGYIGEILLVGVNYDKENKNKPHNCVIEKIKV